jgi:hypothetical protein
MKNSIFAAFLIFSSGLAFASGGFVAEINLARKVAAGPR